MPNWCMNRLTVSHEDPAKLSEFCQAYNAGKMLSHYLPQPEYLQTGEIITTPGGEEIKCMSDDEWQWRVANWGTKWDISPGQEASVCNGEVCVLFDSAWSPPVGLWPRLEALGFRVTALYWEPGMGFCGKYGDGEDQDYDTSDEDVPEDIKNEFDFASFYAEEDA